MAKLVNKKTGAEYTISEEMYQGLSPEVKRLYTKNKDLELPNEVKNKEESIKQIEKIQKAEKIENNK